MSNFLTRNNEDDIILQSEAVNKIIALEESLKNLKETYDSIKQGILEEMEQQGLIKLDSEVLSITYIAPNNKELLDTTRLKNERNDVYQEYIKITPVRSSIRIKVKS